MQYCLERASLICIIFCIKFIIFSVCGIFCTLGHKTIDTCFVYLNLTLEGSWRFLRIGHPSTNLKSSLSRSFAFHDITIWNELVDDVISVLPLSPFFRQKLKSYLFSNSNVPVVTTIARPLDS